ncbi:D-3-phosphoglycerate dehydrogenase [Coniochaeta sp. 2T2.1]|nr:D-3-phosphoglycerate dehydrogenase [Coniochaeta sp. 2T2.1]
MGSPGTSASLSNDILLVYLPTDPDPSWVAKMESKYPGLQVRWPVRGVWGQLYLDAAAWDGVTMTSIFLPHPIELMKSVRFVQLSSAGADLWTSPVQHPKYADPDVIFCTANGTHPPQIAESVFGTYLMMSHRLLDYHAIQKEAVWRKTLYDIEDAPGKRIGILGYGAIGRQVARIASALGMEVYAYTRSERATPESRRDDSYCVPGTGDPDGTIPAKWFHGASVEAVNAFLAQDLDMLVISLPITNATRKLIGREQFQIMSQHKKTFVSNIARGAIIDQDALIEALNEGWVWGAALDVTDPEPLPDGHPLWTTRNVIVTPHVSWQTPHYWSRVLKILEINLERLARGEGLINVVDRENNY